MIEGIILYAISYLSLYVSIFYLFTFLENRNNLNSPLPKNLPKISILIPAFNEEKVIASTIESALNVDYPEKEIIVVDDGSTDATYDIAKSYEKDGVKAFKKENGGKGSTLNFGLPKCSSEFILTLDADCLLSKDCLKKMIPYFDDPKVMAVIPTQRVWKPTKIIEKIQAIGYTTTFFIRKIVSFMRSLDVVPGAPLYRAKFFREHGGFDEDNLTEDFEMGLRIQSKNYDVAHALDGFVYTVVPNTFKKLMRQRIRWNYGTLFNIKKYSFMLGPKYGDLGMLVLPITVIFFIFSVFLLSYFFASFALDAARSVDLLSLTNYDLEYQIMSFRVSSIIDRLLTLRYMLLGFLLFLGALTYSLGKKYTGEKWFKLEYLASIFAFWAILALFQFIAMIRFLTRKKPGW